MNLYYTAWLDALAARDGATLLLWAVAASVALTWLIAQRQGRVVQWLVLSAYAAIYFYSLSYMVAPKGGL